MENSSLFGRGVSRSGSAYRPSKWSWHSPLGRTHLGRERYNLSGAKFCHLL